MKTGLADLPLHPGHCPPWLFKRMRALGGAIADAIVLEHGSTEFLARLSNPFFFQSLGCVLGFDWHSSGVTTTVCGALKEGIPQEIGVVVCGGKGAVSRKTPSEIEEKSELLGLTTQKTIELTHASKMSAKVDNAAVQDGYSLYHHVLAFNEKGEWTVIQQGLNDENHYARRYHWLSKGLHSFVQEPHAGICCDARVDTLNMVARESTQAQKISVDLAKEGRKTANLLNRQTTLVDSPHLVLPAHHSIPDADARMLATLKRAREIQPRNYEELLAIEGVGPKTIRALALIAELSYGEKASWLDPVNYSFAHGGKDGIPYPVDRSTYDKSVEILRTAIEEAKAGKEEKIKALKKLQEFWRQSP